MFIGGKSLITIHLLLGLFVVQARGQIEKEKEIPFPYREWKSTSGSTLVARLTTLLSKDEIALTTKDKKVLQLKSSSLSDEDQTYARTIWYQQNPIRIVRTERAIALSPNFHFFDSLGAKIDTTALRFTLPEWQQVRDPDLQNLVDHLEKLNQNKGAPIYILDSAWRHYVAGSNHTALLLQKIKTVEAMRTCNFQIILVDEPLHGNVIVGMNRDKIPGEVAVEKGIQQVDEFIRKQAFIPNLHILNMRNLKRQTELACPSWRIESVGPQHEYEILQSAAIATLITGIVPPMEEIQKAMIAERKLKLTYPPIPENSFISLSEPSLLKIKGLLRDLIPNKAQ